MEPPVTNDPASTSPPDVAPAASTTVTFGWDASHYDGKLTRAVLQRAKAEGIRFFTHKIGEGLGGTDATQGTALSAARSAGIALLGGYWFLHGNDDATTAAKKCVETADKYESWWRDLPGWFWQTDAETSSSGLPSPSYVKKFSDALAERSGRTVIVYASRGMYGNRLDGLGHRLWNADYGSNPHGQFGAVYPGNSSRGWTPYSGQTPTILQFGSNTTIAGLTTCDANAFRGSVAELTAIIEGDDMPLSDSDIAKIATQVWSKDGTLDGVHVPPRGAANTNGWAGKTGLEYVVNHMQTLLSTVADQGRQLTAMSAAITALTQSEKVDTQSVLDAIAAAGRAESATVTALQQQIAALQAARPVSGSA